MTSAWSPSTISYSGNNRTHTIRIPDADRFELRLADGAVNPYLLPAALIADGLDGIANQLDPGPRWDNNNYTQPLPAEKAKPLPANLLDALRALEQNSMFSKTLGDSFTTAYVKLKHQAWNEYSGHISPWEL